MWLVIYNLVNEEQVIYLWVLLFSFVLHCVLVLRCVLASHCVLPLCCILALHSVLTLHCILHVVFIAVLFPQPSSDRLHLFLQSMHSAASVAKVGPLAAVSHLLIRHECSSVVFYCVVSGAFSCWFVWDCVLPLPPLHISL